MEILALIAVPVATLIVAWLTLRWARKAAETSRESRDLQQDAAKREQEREEGRLNVRFSRKGGAFIKNKEFLELGITIENVSSKGEVLTDFELQCEPNGHARFLEEAAGFPELKDLYDLVRSERMAPGAVISGKLRFEVADLPFEKALLRVVGERNTAERWITWEELKPTRER